MMLIQAVYKIQNAGMQVLLEADPNNGDTGLRAYAWSDQNGYECYVTLPVGIHDHLDDAEVAALDRVIEAARQTAIEALMAAIGPVANAKA